jgi:hypothetical protein
MPDSRVEETVRSAVEAALQRHVASLRETVVQEVLREVGSAVSSHPGRNESGIAALQKAVSAIQAGATQKEILRALLESTFSYSGRAALFVVKNGAATGWQGTGFVDDSAIKDFSLNVSWGLSAAVMQSRALETGEAAQFDQKFLAKFGTPSDGRTAVLPLLLKDKISALIYADGGDGSILDTAALDVLVRATSAWLEVISQRKQAQKEGSSDGAEISHSAPSNDPFAAHAPLHSAKAQHVAEAAPAAMSAAAGVATSAAAVTIPAGEDSEVHRKAQRFARLLMDEIKLYNQAKVNEGRQHKDLYDRLKDDVEKSRVTYQKRYGNTAAASADYFNQEVIRSLAEDDVSLLGSNFRR